MQIANKRHSRIVELRIERIYHFKQIRAWQMWKCLHIIISSIINIKLIKTFPISTSYLKCLLSISLQKQERDSYRTKLPDCLLFHIFIHIFLSETAMGVSVDALSKPNSAYVRAVKK